MRDQISASDQTGAAFASQIHASARARARTAAHLRARGPAAVEEGLLMGLTTGVLALLVLMVI